MGRNLAVERERRCDSDRRSRPTNPFDLRSLVYGRRRSVRRSEDRCVHYYVDRYDSWSVAIFLLVICLSVVDGFVTLHLVSAGGRELNPFMDFVLIHGALPFLLVKYFLTGSGILFMIVHKEYHFLGGRISGKSFLTAIFLIYCALVVWEIELLSRLH